MIGVMINFMGRKPDEAFDGASLRATTTTTTTRTTKNMYWEKVNNKQSKHNVDKRWWKSQQNLVELCVILLATTMLKMTPTATATTSTAAPSSEFRPLSPSATSGDDDSDFRPMILPEHQLLENISIKGSERQRVFQPHESEPEAATSTMVSKRFPWQRQQQQTLQQQLYANKWKLQKQVKSNTLLNNKDNESATQNKKQEVTKATATTGSASTTTSATVASTTLSGESAANETLDIEQKSLEDLLLEYVENYFTKGQYKPLPGLVSELKNRSVSMADLVDSASFGRDAISLRRVRHVLDEATAPASSLLSSSSVSPAGDSTMSSGSSAFPAEDRSIQSGRLLFITGLKKILWPIFVGLQILKSLLFAMFLPSLIGTFGKLVSKGITSASIRPLEPPQDLDFRDNTFNFDEENNKFIIHDDGGKDDGSVYSYHQPAEAASQTQYDTYNSASLNGQALSRYGTNEKQLQKMPDAYMSALQSIGAASFKNSGSLSSSSIGQGGAAAPFMGRKPMAAANANNFQVFQKVPSSSLLLSNYDPFYSPLLSRLDSVFAQLKLNSEKEMCREKLICLMYSNPAKYAPYSNLVSAQLSRELNELRKPTSDNPDILRFFKYMRAAKDGQDGIDCETSFDGCKEFKDFENPAMVATFHDINKLVQARKIGA